MKQNGSKNYLLPFALVTSLFFFWGFVHNLDPILIPHLKKSFSLSTLQSSLVDSAVFIGYFVMALPAGFIMKRYGYKAGILTGLALFALGSFLFIPAANTQLYAFFLAALFIIACGLTILETVANPYASLLGDPSGATRRLNFAQSFNGLAATLAPIIGARIILTKGFADEELAVMTDVARKAALASEASSVKMPYFVLGSAIVLIAILFALVKLPEIHTEDQESSDRSIRHAWAYPHLRWAVLAQFCYVGAQVCVFSFFILFAVDAAGIDKVKAADYLGWGCGMAFMTGRFAGTFLMRFFRASSMLAVYAALSACLCLVAMFGSGMITICAVIALTFFMSIMFPTIFSLGIDGLGADAKFGSSLIIMSIVGGAVLPPLMAQVGDMSGSMQTAYIIPLACFLVVLVFGLRKYKIINPKQHA